jgi:hypothetical protein
MTMPLGERKKRHAELYDALLRNDVSLWGERFLKALEREPARKARRGGGADGSLKTIRVPPVIGPA